MCLVLSCCGFVITLLINSRRSSLVIHILNGAALDGILQGSALGSLLFLIYVYDMPLLVKHGILVQFADDTCKICCGEDHSSVSQML